MSGPRSKHPVITDQHLSDLSRMTGICAALRQQVDQLNRELQHQKRANEALRLRQITLVTTP